jgi:hypothetical protein
MPKQDKTDDVKDSFYNELGCVFNKLPKYHTTILLEKCSAKVGREGICKMTNWVESLHKIYSINAAIAVNLATSNNVTSRKYYDPTYTVVS